MLRRVISATFVLALGTMLDACGHQVTPNVPGGESDLAGDIVVKFQTAGTLDFTGVTYVIAIDMCGTGVPYPNALATGYTSYTFAIFAGGGFGSTAEPLLYQYFLIPGSSGLTKVQVNTLTPSTASFVTPYQGNSNEFEFIFPRRDLNNPYNAPLPCPNSSATAGSDTTGVNAPPYLTAWTFNLLTFNPTTGTPLDSLGPGGPSDNQFSGIVVNTASTNFYTVNSAYTGPSLQNPGAQITYGEVDTYAL
jgi:hypothetical protein